MKTVLITGSSGFIATNFCQKFADKYKFILVSHKPQVNHITLNQLVSDDNLIKSIDVIINLAGANIANGRWTTARKNELLQSRLEVTKQLIEIFNQYNSNAHLISASAVGIYDFNTINDDNTPIDYSSFKNFSQQLTKQWEQTALGYHGLVTVTRFGVVLSGKGGAMSKMLPPFLFGLGGQLGSGQQGFPWIALDDLLSALDFIIDKKYTGVFNFTAPEQINNEQLTKYIGQVWRRPIFMKMPACMIKLLWGQMGEEFLLNGNQALPQRLINSGFKFKYPNILSCLNVIKERI
jgi:uncharacterized protein (TIGR01777 family)